MNQVPVVWVTTRAAGILAFVLLTMSMVGGLVLKTRPFGRRVRGVSAMEFHRSLTIASLAALAIHGVMLVMDKTIDITWSDLLVPGALPFKPVWTGLGVVAGELMLILVVSYRFRRKLTMPVWRRLHYASYMAFVFATLHGIFAGSSTKTTWMQAIYIGAIAMVLGATVFRILSPAPSKPAAPPVGARRPSPTPVATEPITAPAAPVSRPQPVAVRSARRHEPHPHAHHGHTVTRRHEVPAASASK